MPKSMREVLKRLSDEDVLDLGEVESSLSEDGELELDDGEAIRLQNELEKFLEEFERLSDKEKNILLSDPTFEEKIQRLFILAVRLVLLSFWGLGGLTICQAIVMKDGPQVFMSVLGILFSIVFMIEMGKFQQANLKREKDEILAKLHKVEMLSADQRRIWEIAESLLRSREKHTSEHSSDDLTDNLQSDETNDNLYSTVDEISASHSATT